MRAVGDEDRRRLVICIVSVMSLSVTRKPVPDACHDGRDSPVQWMEESTPYPMLLWRFWRSAGSARWHAGHRRSSKDALDSAIVSQTSNVGHQSEKKYRM